MRAVLRLSAPLALALHLFAAVGPGRADEAPAASPDSAEDSAEEEKKVDPITVETAHQVLRKIRAVMNYSLPNTIYEKNRQDLQEAMKKAGSKEPPDDDKKKAASGMLLTLDGLLGETYLSDLSISGGVRGFVLGLSKVANETGDMVATHGLMWLKERILPGSSDNTMESLMAVVRAFRSTEADGRQAGIDLIGSLVDMMWEENHTQAPHAQRILAAMQLFHDEGEDKIETMCLDILENLLETKAKGTPPDRDALIRLRIMVDFLHPDFQNTMKDKIEARRQKQKSAETSHLEAKKRKARNAGKDADL